MKRLLRWWRTKRWEHDDISVHMERAGGQPTKVQIYRGGRMVFDGLDKSAFFQEPHQGSDHG